MSLFERIQNKRYDLQERKKKFGPGSDGRVNPGGNNNKDENIKKDLSQRRTSQDNQQQRYNRQYDAYDDGDLGNPEQQKSSPKKKIQSKSKTFNQSFGTPTGADPKTGKPTYKPSYTIDAKGKKKLGPDIGGIGDDKTLPKGAGNGVPQPDEKGVSGYDRVSKKLGDREAAKKTYLDPKTGKASDEGIKKYIKKARQMKTGSNVPVDSKTTDSIAKISKSEYKNKINQKYGGRRATLDGTKNLKKVNLNFKNFKNSASKALKKTKPILTGLKRKAVKFGIRHPGKTLAGLALGSIAVNSLLKTATNKAKGQVPISNKNTKSLGPIVDKDGKELKYQYNLRGINSKGESMPKNVSTNDLNKGLKSGKYRYKSGQDYNKLLPKK